jgi:branched-chain amino acid aminotransferase
VKPGERFLFNIITFPFGSYYSAPVDVLVTEEFVRAFPGGTGGVKPAGNYAPTLIVDRKAQAGGFSTVMWLDGREHRYIEECGVMNVFFVLKEEDGTSVITPELSGTILPGVTRDSVITLLRDLQVPVQERLIAIDEITTLHRDGRLLEAFGTGTAATLSHIQRIRYRDQDYILPPVEQRSIGPIVREKLVAIATGRAPDKHSWLYKV